VLERLGEQQVRRHTLLNGVAAQRFLVGRALLVEVVEQLTDVTDLAFTTTCERCGADHGRPRFERAPVAVSVSYAGGVVAVAAARIADAAAVGVDIERAPTVGQRVPMRDLAPLFAPALAPDMQGWTLIEAALKADGRGIAIDLPDVRVGETGSGRLAGSRAIRLPDRVDTVDAGVIAGPADFVLSAAMIPAAAEQPPG
jgi:4'-phosphopantetheinyl transferase